MTILDRGSNSKNKEENAQARQSNLDNVNSNRKQRTRTNHPTRTDRGLSHGLNVPAASNIDSAYRANYWDDSSSPASHHSPEYVDPPHIQLSHNEINIHGHIKPRGLSKSSSVVQSPNPESLHVMSEPSAAEDISHASNIAATIDSAHAVSYSAKNLSRVVKKTTEKEDGACLFRAVADQVYGDQGMHDEVRKNCMNYMNKNADYFKNYVTEDFEAYINRKRDVHEFGNHLEMQAMAELYSRPFEVYQYSTDPINTFQSSNSSANVPIRVSYHKNSHYNSVIDPYVATIGVGLGLPSFTPGLVDKNMLNDAVKASCEVWEQQMLNDKVQATDWENTDDAILKQVARESYIAYLEHNTSDVPGKNDRKTPEKSPNEEKQFEKSSKSRVVKEFPKKTNKTTAHSASDWVAEEDEWEVLSQVLANSQQEYMDVLKHQATHSKATCSKYT